MRLFLALVPSDLSLDLLEKYQKELGNSLGSGQPVRRDHLHLTLRFVASGPGGSVPALAEEGEKIFQRIAGFNDLGCPDLSYDTRSVPGLALLTFAPDLRFWTLLSEILETPLERPFFPHVTLFRRCVLKIPSVKRILPSLPFSFSRLALFESRLFPDGSRYSPLQEWPFPLS